jgi:hypothetical protein
LVTRDVMMDADPRDRSVNVLTGPGSAEVAEVEEASKPA